MLRTITMNETGNPLHRYSSRYRRQRGMAPKVCSCQDILEIAKQVSADEGAEARPLPANVGNPEFFQELTTREKDVLRILIEGESNKGIARWLGISDGTVKLYVRTLFTKMGVQSRVKLAVISVENGFCHLWTLPKRARWRCRP